VSCGSPVNNSVPPGAATERHVATGRTLPDAALVSGSANGMDKTRRLAQLTHLLVHVSVHEAGAVGGGPCVNGAARSRWDPR
jgi:hypothetical protein